MSSPKLEEIAKRVASADVYTLAKRTALQTIGDNIWLKREDQQDVFSFKIRGAANRMAKLTPQMRKQGVTTASAGNHAQGVAAASAYYGVQAVIFMPVTTPEIKTKAVLMRGAQVRLVGDSYDEAYDAALAYAKQNGAVFIHPFDDLDVIAGQGTIGVEILDQLDASPAALYIPVGGGGLIAGVGAVIKTQCPNTKIIAVEPEGAATLKTSLDAGTPTSLGHVDGFADGVAVKKIGTLTLELAKQIDPDIVLVSNEEISASARMIFEHTRTVVEPAGALALAGLLKQARQGKKPDGACVVILSGANVNFDRIGHMVERAELGGGAEIMFAATLPERPGAFLNFCEALGDHPVSEFNYRYADSHTAHVLVGVKIKGTKARDTIFSAMQKQGIDVTDLSHNRLAKEHLRHMVGGRSSNKTRERIYSFEFPERPGALKDFLTALDGRWNISLFHYRNHGASTGQVLCGFQVPDHDSDVLEASLKKTGFAMKDETDNPAYQYFLKA